MRFYEVECWAVLRVGWSGWYMVFTARLGFGTIGCCIVGWTDFGILFCACLASVLLIPRGPHGIVMVALMVPRFLEPIHLLLLYPHRVIDLS
jgi:hypothetical protein